MCFTWLRQASEKCFSILCTLLHQNSLALCTSRLHHQIDTAILRIAWRVPPRMCFTWSRQVSEKCLSSEGIVNLPDSVTFQRVQRGRTWHSRMWAWHSESDTLGRLSMTFKCSMNFTASTCGGSSCKNYGPMRARRNNSVAVESGPFVIPVASDFFVPKASASLAVDSYLYCTCDDRASSSADSVFPLYRCVHCIKVSYEKRGREQNCNMTVSELQQFNEDIRIKHTVTQSKNFLAIAAALRVTQQLEPQTKSARCHKELSKRIKNEDFPYFIPSRLHLGLDAADLQKTITSNPIKSLASTKQELCKWRHLLSSEHDLSEILWVNYNLDTVLNQYNGTRNVFTFSKSNIKLIIWVLQIRRI